MVFELLFQAFITQMMLLWIDQLLDRIGIIIIPVFIKGVNDFIGGRTDQHHIDIGKLIAVADVIILVTHIAPANQGNLVIGNKAFIVHAPVDTF